MSSFINSDKPLLVQYINMCKLAHNEFVQKAVCRILVGEEVRFNEIEKEVFEQYKDVINRWTLKSLKMRAFRSVRNVLRGKNFKYYRPDSYFKVAHKVGRGIIIKNNILRISYWSFFEIKDFDYKEKIKNNDIIILHYHSDEQIYMMIKNYDKLFQLSPYSIPISDVVKIKRGIK